MAPGHRKYDADFAAAGYRPRVVQLGTTPQALLALVAAGVGVTRLPLSSRNLRVDGVAFVPLTGERAQVVLITRPDAANPALQGAARDALASAVGGARNCRMEGERGGRADRRGV